jgi:hypothetical protein
LPRPTSPLLISMGSWFPARTRAPTVPPWLDCWWWILTRTPAACWGLREIKLGLCFQFGNWTYDIVQSDPYSWKLPLCFFNFVPLGQLQLDPWFRSHLQKCL